MILLSSGFSSPDVHMPGTINLRTVVLIVILELVASQAFSRLALSTQNGYRAPDSTLTDHPAAAINKHTVKLSWAASVPASKLPQDAVVGYNIYRSGKAHDRKPKRINSVLCTTTTYTDIEVEAGKTYFYVTRGVTAKGVESASSNETKVVIPSP